MPRNILVCLWSGGLLVVGCSKKPAQTNQLNPAPAEASAASSVAEPVVDLAALTEAVRRYGMERQKAPQSLSEVVAAGYIKTMPTAPTGKRFEINPKRLDVILVNQ